VVYGVMTEQSIGALFIAGIVPGVLSALIYAAMIVTRAKLNPKLAPAGERFTWRERFVSLKGVWHVVVIFTLVIGGMYVGIFTPTEAAGVGCFFAAIFGAMKKMGWDKFKLALYDTGKLTAMILLLIIGGIIFGRFLATSGLISTISDALATLPYNRYVVLAIVLLIYFALGMVMDTLAMVILTLPLTFPVVTALGFSPIWFGIIVVKSIEIGLVTPPVGLNAYVVAGVAKDVRLEDVFAGLVWFIVMDIVTLVILVAFPQISLWLPHAMMD
jgi:C4-dicarboxylate transporter, DctM subunit